MSILAKEIKITSEKGIKDEILIFKAINRVEFEQNKVKYTMLDETKGEYEIDEN